jgi:hypothetical protein
MSVYVLFHLILKVPLRSLISASLVAGGATLLLGPLLFCARRYSANHNDDKRVFVLVAAVYFIALTLIGLHYAVTFNLLSPHVGFVLSIMLTIFHSLMAGLTILLNRSLRGGSGSLSKPESR